MKNTPNLSFIKSTVQKLTQEDVLECNRITLGNQNFVYQVITKSNRYVIRVSDKELFDFFKSGQFLQTSLIPLGIPIVPFIFCQIKGNFSIALMREAKGHDLIHVYSKMSRDNKESVAKTLFSYQEIMKTLPLGHGYGYATHLSNNTLHCSWKDFLTHEISRFISRVEKTKHIDAGIFLPALKILDLLDFSNVKPQAFLRDISERNVLIDKGAVSAIVDVDDIGFGDNLMVIALTEVALMEKGLDNYYPQYWKTLNKLDIKAEERYDFYLIFYILNFIKSHGATTFNNQKMNVNLSILIPQLELLYKKFYSKYLYSL